MALCSGLAAVTLTFGVLGSLPALTRRLATVHIPIPVRSLAVLLMMVSTTAVLVRPKPAVATVPPPIVRLVEETPPPTEEVEASTDDGAEETVSGPTPGRSTGTPRVGTEREQPNSDAYVVEPGDSLWRIAASVLRSNGDDEPSSADIARFWPTIYAANRALIGDDPNLIFPGQRLLIPEG